MSWQQLIAQKEDARQMALDDRQKPWVYCPFDNEVLQSNGKFLNCPLGNFRVRVGATQGSR